ncbi:hypothetical protein ACHAPU_009916 [Fusarium lateritium]
MVVHQPHNKTPQQEQSTESTSVTPSLGSSTAYKPLCQDHDCTRLLQILAATKEDDPIICSLHEVAFGERPKFDALSYMWGNGLDECHITLNGVSVKIRQNLHDALYYLRKHTPGTLYWIDAMCINQKDILERNRQVRMMHHIYLRAQTVVVWLGKKYDAYQATIPKLEQLSHGKPPGGGVQSETPSHPPLPDFAPTQEGKLAEELHRDPYWDRLWIIQEIGQAQKIKVCFGSAAAVDWSQFTLFIDQHKGAQNRLKRLTRQREEKHNGSATLLQLLYAHRDAECQDRKDKIYGLVGLASDARNFVIDYNKSLFQIWTDVMEFMNQHGLFQGVDSISVGHLVKSLLMGTNCSPLEQILRQYGPEDDDATIVTNEDHFKAFKLKAAILGRVIHVGPDPHEIVGNLKAVDNWTEKVQANYQNDLGNAHRESDLMIRAMLDLDDVSLSKKCFGCRGIIQWWESYGTFERLFPYTITDWVQDLQQESNTQQEHSLANNSRLFQMRYGGEANPKLGLASSDIRSGDLVFWLEWPRRAVVIRACRQNYRSKLQVVGTAVVADDLRELHLGHSQRKDWSDGKQMLNLHLDARTIFILLA